MDHTDLENRFTYHPPKTGQNEVYAAIRARALTFAVYLDDVCPDSRELSLAITHLEEVVYAANASIARHG